MTTTLMSGPGVARTRWVGSLLSLACDMASDARSRIAFERSLMGPDEHDSVEVVADCTRDIVADVLHGERLADVEYDYVRDVVLDMLRCNGEAIECAAAAVVMWE